jgi:16S rRNA G1207 methylase RsmC
MNENANTLTDLYLQWWVEQNASRKSGYVRFEGRDFWIEHNVFSPDPRLTNSTRLMTRSMANVTGQRVLELGTGSGVLGILAAHAGAAEVLAVDVDPNAIANANRNIEEHGVADRVRVVEGDLFEPANGVFDLVLANLPIAPRLWDHVGGNVEQLAARFLNELPRYLAPEGRALFSWASFGDLDGILRMMKERQVPFEHITEETFGATWHLFTIRHR